eukprot:2008700-Pleurochrysis_carterae.AAC.3
MDYHAPSAGFNEVCSTTPHLATSRYILKAAVAVRGQALQELNYSTSAIISHMIWSLGHVQHNEIPNDTWTRRARAARPPPPPNLPRRMRLWA